MARLTKKQKKKLYTILTVAAIVICLVLEIGQKYPNTHLPSWDTVFNDAGLHQSAPVDGVMELHVIDVGNADCLLIRQGETSVLIDAGEKATGFEVVEYLKSQGVTALDLVIATHPHSDHIGGMETVIRNMPIRRFVMAPVPESVTPTTSCYVYMLKWLDKLQVPVDKAEAGKTYPVGDGLLTILAPINATEDYNDMSIVSYLTFGDTHYLLMADAQKAVEEDILRSGTDIRADVIKISHHGSDTASAEKFIRAVSPRFAAITCGAGNDYGHPHTYCLRTLKKLNIDTYRCDLHGTLIFTSDGRDVTVKTEKGEGQ